MQRIGTRQKWIPVYSSSTLQILMGSDIGISLGWIKPSGLPVYSYYLQLKGCETQWRSLTGARWRSYMKWPLLTIIYNGHLSMHRIFEETLLTFNINSSVTHCLSGFLYNHRIPKEVVHWSFYPNTMANEKQSHLVVATVTRPRQI